MAALTDEWSAWIDQATGWWFEARALTLRLDCHQAGVLFLPAPVITLDELAMMDGFGGRQVLDPSGYIVYDRRPWAGGMDDRYYPRIAARERFAPGRLRYEAVGTFGFVEEDGSAPAAIRRACVLLTLAAADPAASRERPASDLRSITVQGRSESYAGPTSASTISGLPEVDRIIQRYRCPPFMGAAP